MEEVLDAYAEPVNPDEPLVNMDEAAKELHADLHEPTPAGPGVPRRQDDRYERRGVANLFLFLAPHAGWRRVGVRGRRGRPDWAHEVRRLLDEDFPAAARVTLVCDNPNTHSVASPYAAFPAAEAHRLARRLRIVHTPRNGSWLNAAEVELSVLSRQCLNRRVADPAALDAEVAAWAAERNAAGARVSWQFTTADARVKLRRLYPQF
jgi:hypothetical protein